jgi:NADPH:quinone reductase-like Zn-dependent oxidoreductase
VRAAVFTQTGDPVEVLSVADVEEPHAGPGQVRVAVRAAGVNPVDWKIVTGVMGKAPQAPVVPGIDAAGVVDEVGEGVQGVQVGDEVFGHATGGSAAQYAVLSAWTHKPAATSFEVAGALPVVGERSSAPPVGTIRTSSGRWGRRPSCTGRAWSTGCAR